MTVQELYELITGKDGISQAGLFPGSDQEGPVRRQLERLGFADWSAAARALRRLTPDTYRREIFAQFAPHLLTALSSAGGPDRTLAAFERFIHSAQNPIAMYRLLAEQPRAVELLIRLFSGSQFLSEILLRNPEYFKSLIEYRRLSQPKTRETLLHEARAAAERCDSYVDQLDALRRFQRWELLRIGACDLFGLFDLPSATLQLSHLSDSLVQVCLEISARQLGISPDGFAVIGMGKLGGQELNYSSDIDFLFLSTSPSAAATRLGERLVDALARVTTEGFLYRVDMRLRPWGKVGPLVSSPDGYLTYLTRHALLWEKQALLKARAVAGDRSVARDFIQRARPLLFGGEVESVRADVYAMKQRTEAFLQQKGRVWGDVKLGEGSIRDVEFAVQFLQLAHGMEQPAILSPNTLDALSRCHKAGLLSLGDYRVLAEGYVFLRTIEHYLQMMDYRQTHTLPDDPDAILSLARRLGYEGQGAGDQFLSRYRQHAAAIREVYLRTMGSVEMQPTNPARSPSDPAASGQIAGSEQNNQQQVDRHRARMNPSYLERFSEDEIHRHAVLAGQLDQDHLVIVDAQPAADQAQGETWEVTLVAYDYPGELSIICGLLFAYGFDIVRGDVFTYEPADENNQSAGQAGSRPMRLRERARRASKSQVPARDTRRKIVDAFTVRRVHGSSAPSIWSDYTRELEGLLQMLRAGQHREARGELAERVGNSLYEAHQASLQGAAQPLYPVEIEIDNESDEQYTVLRIDTPDIPGFLYEFTNALAVNGIYIAQVIVDSVGDRASDILYVTDDKGEKITSTERLRELRAATVLIKHFTHLLRYSPNPKSALQHFPEFLAQLFQRPNWPDELGSLERPEVLQALARLLGVSDFLWDDFLRMQYVNLYPVVRDVETLPAGKSRQQLQAELETLLEPVRDRPRPVDARALENQPWQDILNAFKDREMFRIDMRHILGYMREFWDFAAELTGLAEVVVNAAYHLCYEDLQGLYGTPRLEDGSPCEMAVLALGKCGGRELGFASDIELMFVYAGSGKTDGPQAISNAEFFEKLVTHFVRAIRARREGIFEIDLQLRPYGKAGSLSVALDAFRRYYAPQGPAWAYERQALVKLRPIAGSPELGQAVTALRDAYVYTGDPFDVTAMRAMRERQVRHLVTGGMFNLKYSPGGLVDIEYLVQALQITHGYSRPNLRLTNTREAMAALAGEGLLAEDDYTRLRKAHTFLRWLIDSMRVVRGNARDVTMPPEGSEEFAFLTRRMNYGRDQQRLRSELLRYTAGVQEINSRLLEGLNKPV